MKTLRWRIRVVTAAVSLVAVIPVLLTVAAPASWWTLGRSAKLFQAIPESALNACDADPQAWSFTSTTGVRAFALDPASFEPLHPDAPSISTRLVLRLRAGEQEPVTYSRAHGALVIRRAGPCSLVVVRWPLDGTLFRWVFLLAAVVLLPSVLLAAWVGGRFVLRPILISMDALDRSSRGVGTSAYASPQVEVEFDAVRHALDAAHQRVLAERGLLEDQKSWLEQHIADVAHDLRTPLTSLQLHLERTRHDPHAVTAAIADVAYLTQLTENLALSGQLRSGLRSHTELVDAGAIAMRVVNRFGVLASGQGHEVIAAVPDTPVPLHSTGLYLEQILNNLVHNALRHHDRPGTVVLVVEPGPPVVFEVCDDGPGDPETLPTERAEAQQTHGLGLAIVRTLVEHLGGSLTIRRNEPRGLTFRIELDQR